MPRLNYAGTVFVGALLAVNIAAAQQRPGTQRPGSATPQDPTSQYPDTSGRTPGTVPSDPTDTRDDRSAMSNRPATEEEQQFLQKAAQGGKAEVEMGRLAQQKSSSEAVKKIGKTLEKDHQKANSRLEKLASNLGTQVPNQPNEEQSAAAQHLESLSGTEFDREFLEHMAKDHDKDIQEFEQAASRFDGPVKKFASQTLPSLRKHREMIGKAMNQADTQTGSSSGSTESSKTAR